MPIALQSRTSEVEVWTARGAAQQGRAYVRARLGVTQLVDDANGKPFVPGGPPFSIAHAGDVVVVAVATRPVGIDVEAIVPLPDLDLLIASYATAREAYLLASLPAVGRVAAFLRLWVRKEAVLKAVGVGIAGEDPGTVDVTEPACVAGGAAYRVIDLDVGRGYVGALALAGTQWPRVRDVRA